MTRDFWLGAIRDPVTHDASSSRIAGLAAIVAGIVLAFIHPERAATVTALVGGGAVPFLTRVKISSDAEDEILEAPDDVPPEMRER